MRIEAANDVLAELDRDLVEWLERAADRQLEPVAREAS